MGRELRRRAKQVRRGARGQWQIGASWGGRRSERRRAACGRGRSRRSTETGIDWRADTAPGSCPTGLSTISGRNAHAPDLRDGSGVPPSRWRS